jgi:micrococcal nuclease
MSNIVHFPRRQEVGSWVRHKPLQKTWKPSSQRRARRIVLQCRNLFLAALVGGLATQYAMKHGPTNSNTFQQFASNASTSQITSSSVRFELCGQGTRTNCVVDGDTIWYGGVKIRLATIDAPEIHDYKCSSELALGERSKRRLLELMNAGPFEVVRSGSRDEDKYGRKLRDVRRDGKSLGDTLIAEGLASPWEGRHHAWC